MEKPVIDDRLAQRGIWPVPMPPREPMPATDDMLTEIAALRNPIRVAPLSPDEKGVLKRTGIGLGVIVLALLLVAGIGAVKSRGGHSGYTPAQQERW